MILLSLHDISSLKLVSLACVFLIPVGIILLKAAGDYLDVLK